MLNQLRSALSTEISPAVQQSETKLASVLITIFDLTEPKILMTKKASHLKIHAGEIAFPGGKLDSTDSDLLETALRETREEINLNISRDQVIGQLQPVQTLNSGFTIIPFVTVIEDISELQDNREVELILKIPLVSFLKTLQNDPDPLHQSLQEMYAFTYQDHLVWGASARMLKQIVDVLNQHNLL